MYDIAAKSAKPKGDGGLAIALANGGRVRRSFSEGGSIYSFFMVKLLRAYGGCLGRGRR